MPSPKILVTGASGQLGTLVVDQLLSQVDVGDLAVLVRREDAKAGYETRGIDARLADYSDPVALEAALQGIDRLLLISSSEVGQRAKQHANVIAAAKAAGVAHVVYTSLLRAAESPLALAEEHVSTEEALSTSGLAHTILRNGWYSENITAALPQDLEMGQHFGTAGAGKFATAARADYAAAAVAVLTGTGHEGKTYELAGDNAYSLSDYASILSDVTGQAVAYADLPEEAFREALVGAGLPDGLAAILADSDAKARDGWLDSDSRDLSALIGRPTTPVTETINAALAG